MTHQVYTLSHPQTGEVRYVGKTKNGMEARLRSHLKAARRTQKTGERGPRLHYWINSLPSDPIIEELEAYPDEKLTNEGETFWISYFRFVGFRLVNHGDGGEGRSGDHASDETKRKMSIAHMGHKCNVGKVRSQELRIRISRTCGGRPFTDQHGNRYETIRGMSRDLGLDRAHVLAVLKGRSRSHKGYVFTYLDEPILSISGEI